MLERRAHYREYSAINDIVNVTSGQSISYFLKPIKSITRGENILTNMGRKKALQKMQICER